MKVTKQELIRFGLFDTLPDELKNLADRNYYVIYYNVIEEESKLNIVTSEVELDSKIIEQYHNINTPTAPPQNSDPEVVKLFAD